MITSKYKKLTSSGIIYTGHCKLTAMLIGTDATNDPTVTVYDGINNTGDEVIPTNEYDASVKGLNGASLPFPVECWTGIYVEITCGGTVEVVIHYKDRAGWGVG